MSVGPSSQNLEYRTQLCEHLLLLGVPSLLVEDEGFYHLKAIISDSDMDSLRRAAAAMKTFSMNPGGDGSDARLSKSTLLRLSNILRQDSVGAFPNLTKLEINRPRSLDSLPLFLCPSLRSFCLKGWDYYKRAKQSKPGDVPPFDDKELTWFVRALTGFVGNSLTDFELEVPVPPAIISCIPEFTRLRHLDIDWHNIPPDCNASEVAESVFNILGVLGRLDYFGFFCRRHINYTSQTPSQRRPFTGETIKLALTASLYVAMAQHLDIKVVGLGAARISLWMEGGLKVEDLEGGGTQFYEGFLRMFIARSQLRTIDLTVESSTFYGGRNRVTFPFFQLAQLFDHSTLLNLWVHGWVLQLDDIQKAIEDSMKKTPDRGSVPFKGLTFGQSCQWEGFSLKALLLLAQAYPALEVLRCATKIEDVSNIDTSALDGLKPSALMEFTAWEVEPLSEEVDIKRIIGVAKYLKKVFPKLRDLTSIKSEQASRRWLLVKDLVQ